MSHYPPPNWFCPRCGWQNDGYSKNCAQCITPRTQPLKIINISSAITDVQQDDLESASSQRKKKMLGFLGSALLIVGVFMPIVSIPIVGNLNYLYNGRGDGVLVLALAVISSLLILGNFFRGLVVTGLLSLAVMCFTLCHLLARLNSAHADLAQSDNIFKGLGEAILATVQIQWGWLLLVAGGFLIVAAGALSDGRHDTTGRIAPGSQTRAYITLGAIGILMAGALSVSAWFSPGFLRNIIVPTLQSDGSSGLTQLFGSAAPVNAKSDEVKGWRYYEETSEMDGKKSARLSLIAETKIPGMLKEVSPALIIRCRSNKAELLFYTEAMVDTDIWSNTSKVRVRFDDGQPAPQRWSTSTTRQLLFAPKSAQFIKQLMSAKVFLFEFTPYNQAAQVVRFNVSGLDAQIGRIATACPIQ